MISLTNSDSPTTKINLDDMPALIGRSAAAEVVVEDPQVADFQCTLYQLGNTCGCSTWPPAGARCSTGCG